MVNKIFKRFFLAFILVYKKVISPALPRSCRFYPTCSTYAMTAIEKYGPWRGLYLGIRRVLRCHPFNPGGYDPVP